MKRIAQSRFSFDVVRLFDEFVTRRGATIDLDAPEHEFITELAAKIEAGKRNPILMHGFRAQTMFAYVASALGECRILKEEDSGAVFAEDERIHVPDFRLVTRAGREMLVEVKNHHSLSLDEPFVLGADYCAGLMRYGQLFDVEVFIAVYWSALKIWTLLPAARIQPAKEARIELTQAILMNEMRLIGDLKIATLPAIGLRLVANRSKPRTIEVDGRVNFEIERADLLCDGHVIEDSIEQRVAWILLNYGDWPSAELPAEVEGNELVSVTLMSAPVERGSPEQPFEIIGTLSTIVSRQYNDVTAPRGRVERLSAVEDADDWTALIPLGYRGQNLPLWRFSVHPRYQEDSRSNGHS